MTGWILRPLRNISSALVANDSPRQLALGFALGMMLGLVPKGNLVALALGIVLFAIRINTSTGLLAAFAFSWIGLVLDPTAHKLGWLVLTYGPLQGSYTTIIELPLGPLSGLNNTAVVGQLLIGIYLFYPVYWLSLQTFRRLKPHLEVWLRKYRVTRVLFGLDVVY